MALPNLDSFSDVTDWILTRANEETDGTSDWETEAQAAVVAAHRDLVDAYPWLCLEKYPPGVLLTLAPITARTLTVAAAGTAVAVTLDAVPGQDIADWFIQPATKDYLMRVTANGTIATPTVDVAPEVISTAVACTIFKLEYSLASDFNLLLNGLWARGGRPIPVLDDEQHRQRWNIPTGASWPPDNAALIGTQKIRFSSYSAVREPVDYPYTKYPGDPSGSSALTIESSLRTLLANMALPDLLDLKRGFAEAQRLRLMLPGMIEEAKEVDRQRRRGGVFGRQSRESASSPW